MDKKISEYYLGLDIGTDSVGWAVTDTDYNLIKQHGRDYWGSYIFEEASTAEERRQKRTARRRYARTRQRILLLQELFAEEISKVDPLFFLRLNNSQLVREDKDEKLMSKNAIFDDSCLDDKIFYKKYPTIYHLRAALINGEVEDIRFVYLALHHIIKNRGHFLFENQTFDVNNLDMVLEKFNNINAFLSERAMPTLDLSAATDVLAILKDKHIGKTAKQKNLGELLKVGKDKQLKAIIKALVGSNNISLKELYDLDDCELKFSFDSDKYEEIFVQIQDEVGDDIGLIEDIKAIYDWSILCDILGDEQYISKAKVSLYEKHKADLTLLKQYIRSHYPKKQALVFRKQKGLNNYAAYIGMDKKHRQKRCSRDDFYKFLKNELNLNGKEMDADAAYILSEIESGTFLPKLRTTLNSIIPVQLHAKELEAILKNAEKCFEFLTVKEAGLSVSDKIRSILYFKIPYYVGPLNPASERAWVVKNKGQEKTKITPWNFDEVIDKDASEEGFIRRMTNKCTYLKGEDVLPASSLLYVEFTFLNELNNLKINGQKDERARKLIFEYAKSHKKVTLKSCLRLLENNGIVEKGTPITCFTGTDGDFISSLSVYKDLSFLGDKLTTNSEMCEDIILMITLLSDKDRIEKNIRKKYSHILTEEEIKRFKGLNYTKWGRLSKKLLTEITSPNLTDSDGVQLSIIEAMRTTGENFMSLMSKRYGFADAIDEYAKLNAPDEKITYKTIADLVISPSVKRSIWRTIDIVNEVVKVMGKAPKKVFVETAREVNDESRKGKRTSSRKAQLLELYRNIATERKDWIKEIENTPDSKFSSIKYFLYYCQMGKDMYTGENIPLEHIMNVKICDKDHIYPQSKIKDDSIDNLNLVYKTENGRKSDEYPLRQEVRDKMMPFWTELKDKGLISERKFERLIRKTPLTQEELTDFIQRQLVFTRQSTKEVAHMLERMLPDSKIVYAKSGNANEFKDKFDILKIRDLNNLHHAKDAYVNIIAGNIYHEKFGSDAFAYFKKYGLNNYNLNKIYEEPIKGVWDKSEVGRIKKIVDKNSCQVVQMTTTGKGALFDATIYPKGKSEDLVPVKGKGKLSDTSKYGGYNKVKNTYFILVRSKDKHGDTVVSLESFPIMHQLASNGSKEKKLEYLKTSLSLVDPVILLDEIKIKTLIQVNGSYAYICGKTGNALGLANGSELHLSSECQPILKEALKYLDARKKFNNANLLVKETMKKEDNLKLYDEFVSKLKLPIYGGLSIQGQVGFLESSKDKFAALSLEDQCVVLNEILHLLQCNKVNSNFKLLGGKENVGAITLGKNNLQDKDIKFIFQSPTGYYRKVINLKDLL